MEHYDLVITGGQVVSSDHIFPATVAVRGGRIAAVLAPEETPSAADVIHADGLHILPGIIDPHVHLRAPDRPDREDLLSGTSAAAAGGITTILEMPISEPPVNSGAVLAQRAKLWEGESLVDYAMYGAAGFENLDEIQSQAEAGAIAFKTFLHEPQPGREKEFTGLWCVDDGALMDVMRAVARTGLRHCFHCENNAIVKHLIRELQQAGRVDGYAHVESRPNIVEDTSVATVLAIAAQVGGDVHIVHVSSPFAVQLLREARARGQTVTAETCPHYLFLTDDALNQHGPYAKCNPALRSLADQEALWQGVLDGTIDVIGSDHGPFMPAEKERGFQNIFLAPSGLPGLEAMLPLMLTAAHSGRLKLTKVVELMAENPAKLYHMPYKGRIAPGCDADFVLVDLDATWTFDQRRCFTKAQENMRLYHGMEMQGRIVSTLVRGVMVYQEGEITAPPGHGQFIRPVFSDRAPAVVELM